MNLLSFPCFIIFISIFLDNCKAYLKCYSCESTNDNRCGDYFQLQTYDALECQGTCIKRRGRRSGSGIEITRACVIQTSERCTDTTYDGISVTACTCNSDYCNQATDVHLKFPVLFIAVISTFVFKYLL
ncbi:uncharacterized protein LOC143041956 [Mytilus galloprovincialis]|uniref:uncharacterized protein LOC143041956 n=1 Tax=Mytilus galloprovincialis TaxID=29158 RepID=UPI003F7C6860